MCLQGFELFGFGGDQGVEAAKTRGDAFLFGQPRKPNIEFQKKGRKMDALFSNLGADCHIVVEGKRTTSNADQAAFKSLPVYTLQCATSDHTSLFAAEKNCGYGIHSKCQQRIDDQGKSATKIAEGDRGSGWFHPLMQASDHKCTCRYGNQRRKQAPLLPRKGNISFSLVQEKEGCKKHGEPNQVDTQKPERSHLQRDVSKSIDALFANK